VCIYLVEDGLIQTAFVRASGRTTDFPTWVIFNPSRLLSWMNRWLGGFLFSWAGVLAMVAFVCVGAYAYTNVSFEQAASVPVAGVTALLALRDVGHIQAGQKILVDGASGGVGTFAVQIAKTFGAEVTAVCSTGNVAAARALGADHVIDYKHEDFTRSAQRYDVILGANAHRSLFDYKRALTAKGIYVMAGGGGAEILQAMLLGPLLSIAGSKKMGILMAKQDKKNLMFLRDLLASGKLVPVVERTYPLHEAADALRYLEQGHAKGKVVVTIGHRKNTRPAIAGLVES
jgi:NADPH:quinone reductase-like Zn-dependent oxidoreductase